MKKTIPIILIILIITIYIKKDKQTNYNSIYSTIINTSNNTYTIISTNGSIYTINTDIPLKLNDTIKITYNKDINDIKEIKKVNKLIYNKNDIFYTYYDKANNLIKNMTIEEKIGSLLLTRLPDNPKEAINKHHVSGFIYYKKDINNKTKQSIINEIKQLQQISKIPLYIGIDEEGGKVTRLSTNKDITPSPFLSPQELYLQGGFEKIKEDTINKSNILYSLGFNLNFAPVCDVTTNKSSYMYERSFGKDAKLTSQYVETVIENTTNKVSFILKHFPGYGDNIDTHKEISIDKRPYSTFVKNDFLPFQSGINKNAEGIMVSHNYVTSIDKSYPASLGINTHNILRNTLNFSGIIITDDLEMAAAKYQNKYTLALQAGNNLLIVTDYEKAYNEIYENIKNNTITESLIDNLLLRTIAHKYYKNLL